MGKIANLPREGGRKYNQCMFNPSLRKAAEEEERRKIHITY